MNIPALTRTNGSRNGNGASRRASLVGRLLAKPGRSAGPPGPESPYSGGLVLGGGFVGAGSYAGKPVSPESAVGVVPVFSAVQLLAGAVGSLPLVVHRRLPDGTRERAPESRQWRLLHDRPHPELAADELWEIVMSHLLLWGNAYLAKHRDEQGLVDRLWPLKPDRVMVGRADGQRVFRVDGHEIAFTEQDILHIRGLSLDGLVGLSPIQLARQMLGNFLAMEEHQGRFWSRGAIPGGLIKIAKTLDEADQEKLRRQWEALHRGTANAHRVAVLEEGASFEPMSMPLEDAQFVETTRMSDVRVAQLFRVPPYMLGASTGDSLTYSTVEGQGIDFVRWSLRRWLTRIERALARDSALFPPSSGALDRELNGVSGVFPEFLVDGLLRADTKIRYEAHALALASGWMTRGEVRDIENLPAKRLPPGTGEELSALAHRLGIAVNRGILSREEARQILRDLGLDDVLTGPPPEPPQPAGAQAGQAG